MCVRPFFEKMNLEKIINLFLGSKIRKKAGDLKKEKNSLRPFFIKMNLEKEI